MTGVRCWRLNCRERSDSMRLAAERIAAVFLFFAGAAAAQSPTDALHGLSDAVQALSDRASRAVVQVFSTGYTLAEDNEESRSTAAGLVTQQRSTGSGVVLSA